MKTLITTVPFGEINKLPIELLNNHNVDFTINPLNKKLSEDELFNLIPDYDILIAGTEPITKKVLNNADKLKLIARVGIGVDSVDLNEAKKNNIQVTYTPDAPAPAVAELTIGFMLSLLRSIHLSNNLMHNKKWKRIFGKRLSEISIGIIGAGRIGSRVLRRIVPFGTPKILVNDIDSSIIHENIVPSFKLNWVDKETIYRHADMISLHVPKTPLTTNMISYKELKMMKKDSFLINTSRGGIVNESDLVRILSENKIGGAAIDVFNNEPYDGPLTQFENCILTSHMGSMSIDCRARMEIESVEEAIRFLKGEKLERPVPESEYIIQKLENI